VPAQKFVIQISISELLRNKITPSDIFQTRFNCSPWVKMLTITSLQVWPLPQLNYHDTIESQFYVDKW